MAKKIFWILLLFCGAECSATNQAVQFLHDWQVCPAPHYDPTLDPQQLACHKTQVGKPWETVLPEYDGFAVYHNQFYLKDKKQALAFFAEQIRDADKVFINGELIGAMGTFPPQFEKAVLYKRFYPIPAQLLKHPETNDIKIWVYNDARPGGLANGPPLIASQKALAQMISRDNSVSLGIMTAIFVLGLMHLIHFAFNRQLLDSLSFGVFSWLWVAYLWTYSGFAGISDFSMNFLFKSNVVLFFTIFAMFPVFIIQFFAIKMPLALKVVIAVTLLCIPVVIWMPEPGMAYIPLELVEIMTIPAIISITWVFKGIIKEKKPYAKLMVSVLLVYIVFGSADMWLDYFHIVNSKQNHLLGPWALLLLSVVVTMILAHKNRINHDQATIDQLTQAVRLNVFVKQLDDLKVRAKINEQVILVMMLDIDEFKLINDSLGHGEGNRVLRKVAKDIARILRPEDLLGRYGGDEFCLACLLDDAQSAQQKVHYIHLASQQARVKLRHQMQNIRTTIGVYVSDANDDLSSAQMIHKADEELIKGKAINKGGVFGRLD